MTPRVWCGLMAAASAVGCQVQPPESPAPLGRVRPDVLSRFRLEEKIDGPPLLAPLHVMGDSTSADEEGRDAPAATIEFVDVLISVERHFPLILAALEETEIAAGRTLQAQGAFDTKLQAGGEFGVEGYYDNDRVRIGLEQPTTLFGASFQTGYRLGAGDFPVYEGGAKTNEDGELSFGVSVPLLQGFTIDPRRVALWRATIEQDRAQPIILEKRLETTRRAAESYWRWVSWGRRREIAVRLLALADDRQEQVELAVGEGLLAKINLLDNQRLIVERRSELVQAERGLQQAAILLSLYWRDAAGQPVVPPDSALPYDFPEPRNPEGVLLDDAVEIALHRRPELRAIELELAGLELDRSLARNEMLPTLDLGVYASQDIGPAVDDPDDKGPFELEALLRLNVPLQRSKARGRQRELEAKIARLERQRQFVSEVVGTEVQDASSALTQAWERLEQARENLTLANELAEAERLQLREGQSDLFRVNVREQQAAHAAAVLVDVLDDHFRALVQYRAVLGLPYDEVLAGEEVGGSASERR